MCGIAGIVTEPGGKVDGEALLRMRETMARRGPDGAGTWVSPDGDIGLAHRRLAILDLSARAAQPMPSGDGQLQVVFNGEIYNNPELRAWCEHHGAVYRTNSDTETLLHLYRLEGERFVSRLRGMFAFALWDSAQRRLLLARDPLGIKPLYYAGDRHGLRFASQVRALLAGGVDESPSNAGVTSFYLWGYVTEPYTWYNAIRAIPAGSVLHWRPGATPRLAKYVDVLDALRGCTAPSPDAPDLHFALGESVRKHMLSDVPVGLFLSAGVDSGALLALASESPRSTGLRTVTLGFRDHVGQAQDETVIARMIAAVHGSDHREVSYGKSDFISEREALFAGMDQPTIDGANTYFVSRAAAQSGLKVALSGIGGDELFGGYPSFRQVPAVARWSRWTPRIFGRALRRVVAPVVSRLTSPKYAGVLEYGGTVSSAFLLRRALYMPWEIPGLIGEDRATTGLEELDVLASLDAVINGIESGYDQVMALELFIYLRNCLLRDADWAGMAHSLEIRTPLVDAVLLRQLIALRPNGNQPWRKMDLALAPARPLPTEVTSRPKSGFIVPTREWLLRDAPQESQGAGLPRGDRAWAGVVASRFMGDLEIAPARARRNTAVRSVQPVVERQGAEQRPQDADRGGHSTAVVPR